MTPARYRELAGLDADTPRSAELPRNLRPLPRHRRARPQHEGVPAARPPERRTAARAVASLRVGPPSKRRHADGHGRTRSRTWRGLPGTMRRMGKVGQSRGARLRSRLAKRFSCAATRRKACRPASPATPAMRPSATAPTRRCWASMRTISASQLALYRDGKRRTTAEEQLMSTVANRMTDEQMRAVATYLAAQPPGAKGR